MSAGVAGRPLVGGDLSMVAPARSSGGDEPLWRHLWLADRKNGASAHRNNRWRLALLAPDIVEAILGGWADQRVMLETLERPLPMGWEEQWRELASRR